MNFVGIDIGGTNIKAGIVTEEGKILKKSSIKTNPTRPPEKIIADIFKQVSNLTKGIEYEAVGIGCPGAINSKDGTVEYANNLFWKNVPLGSELGRLLNKTVKVCNDANAAALGEHKFGAGKDYSDLVLITLGTGVGTGFIVDGKLFEGYKSMGAEGGHTVIVKDGLKCTCGRNGCFEMYASASALVRETLYSMYIYKNSLMWEVAEHDLDKVDGRTAFTAAKKGDKPAKEVVANYINNIAEGITNILNIFRCQAVIIGGGVSAQKQALTKPLKKRLDSLIYGGQGSIVPEILTAGLGNDAGILGAASLVVVKQKKLK